MVFLLAVLLAFSPIPARGQATNVVLGPITNDSVYATESVDEYLVAAESAGNGTVVGDTNNWIDVGDSASLTATPAEDYEFDQWSDGNTSTDRNFTVTGPTNLTAYFKLSLPGAPAAVWASATNSTDFTAAWDEVPNATAYRLDTCTSADFAGGTYVPGYSNRTVAGTSASVTGLVAHATYHFRARAVNESGTSGNSPAGQVITLKADQAISGFLPTNGSEFVTTDAVGLAASASSGLEVSFAVASGPGTLDGTGTNLSFTGAGSVAVVASQAGDETWNPAPDATNTYNVTKAAATVTLEDLSQVYNGTARTVTVTTVPAGLGVSLTYAGNSWAPTNPGTYAVTGTVSDAMYQGAANDELAVTEAINSGTVGSTDVQVAFGPLASGSNYVLEYRTNLTAGDWAEVDSMVGAGEGSAALTHAGGVADFGYYRIQGVAGPSAQIWGYARLDKPGNSKLNVVGIPFVSSNQTLNSLMDPLQFSGHHNNAGLADQLMMWNPATTSYVNLALYDLRAFGEEYADQTGWKAASGFGPAAPYTNPALPAGSAVWVRGSTTNDRNVVVAGEVVMGGAATNNLVRGLQLIANPFSEQVTLSNLTIHVNAEGHYNNAGLADQIMVWDPGPQGYVNLALYDLRSFGPEYSDQTGWKLADGFGPAAAYVNPEIKPGQGFWFRAVNGAFQWVEPNEYKDGLE